jgi:TRAP-type C4-dicarboxylate transport system substrate-binding protein
MSHTPQTNRFAGQRTRRRIACLTFIIGLACIVAGEAATRIRLATLAPSGSVYHKSLLTLREQWRSLSNRQVDLLVYADGKLGGEAEVVRLMGLNSIQAAMLTVVGLSEIDEGVEGLQSIPMGFRDFAEVDHVGQKLQPLLEQRLAAKGYVVLGWSDAGWIRFFTKKPVVYPNDLKPLKLFSWAGNPEVVSIYRSAGFTATALETADIVPGLETGLIEAVPCPPVFALKTQIDRRAPHMLEINWAPLVGAIVVNQKTWNSLPAELRQPLLQAARDTVKQIRAAGRKESDESVKAMVQRGLQVTRLDAEVVQEWRALAEQTYPKIRGKVVPAEVFDQTIRILQEYRDSQP